MSSERPRWAVAFIFVTILIDMLAFGMIIPVLPGLVQQYAGGNAAHGVEIFGLFSTAWALMQFFFSPVQGALSDRFGRRPVILISCAGLGLDFILMALAPSLAWLFVGRVISGITGASFSTASAYVADITPPEKRAASYGLLGAAFGVGFIAGPGIGGLLGALSPRLPFWAAAAMALANVCWGLFVLPESLPRNKRVPFAWRNANPVGALQLLRSQPTLFALATTLFLMDLAHVVLPSTTVLYLQYRYHWNTAAVGSMLAGVGLCSLVVQGGFVKPAVKLLKERGALLVGLAFGCAGLAIFGWASTGTLFWIGVPVMSLWGIAAPSLQAIMTRCVAETEQGRLQASLASLTGLASLIGPTLFTETFAASISPTANWHAPGAPFYLAAALLLVSMWLASRALQPDRVPAGETLG